MALRDLIVHLDQGESAHGRLRLAANLAQRHGSRLTAIYMRQQNEAQSDLQRTAEMARASCKDFDRIRKHVGLCIDNAATRLQSELGALQRELAIEAQWRSLDGIASKVVPQQARFADLCIVPHRAHSADKLSEKLLFLTGRPVVFVPPDARTEVLGSNVVVAWNSSRAAARSLADALPILERARRVTVVAINPTTFVNQYESLPPERIIEHLKRIREHHAAKLFYYEDSLRLHRENRPKEVRLGPLLTLHRGILAARAYVHWCDEALLLVARGKHSR